MYVNWCTCDVDENGLPCPVNLRYIHIPKHLARQFYDKPGCGVDWDASGDRVCVCHEVVATHNGGHSEQHTTRLQLQLAEKLSHSDRGPTRARSDAINDPKMSTDFIPNDPRQIQRFRSTCNAELLQNAPAESPAELRDFCAQYVRVGEYQPLHHVWVDDQLRTAGETAVPFSADYLFHRLRDYLSPGRNLLTVLGL